MKVLILANKDDAHALAVNKHLAEMKVDADFLRYEHFTHPHNRLIFQFGADSPKCSLQRSDEQIDLQQYFSVWFRRPGRITSQKFPEPWMETMVLQETNEACIGVFNSIQCLWVNNPLANNRSGHKLDQLNMAMQVGMTIPETLVTNDPQAARDFYEKCDGQVIYKMLSESSNQSVPLFEGSAISTLPVRQADLKYMDQVRFAPHFFQKQIQKASDIRVTVVGKKVFAVRIYSQEGRGAVDWRLDYSVKMEAMELPREISDACVEFLRRFELNYGAMDFCETKDGQFIFIENNNAGQYIWLEDRTELQISLELAKLLSGIAEPVAPAPATRCGAVAVSDNDRGE